MSYSIGAYATKVPILEESTWSEPTIVETQNQLTYSSWSTSTTVKTNPSGITDLFDIEEAEFIFHEDEDYLEIKFDEPQWMNFIYFELKDVPLEWQIKYFNSDLNRVVSMTDWYGDDMRGQLVGRFTATEARDARTIRKVDDWIKFSYDIIPVKTSRVEFHFRRTGGRQAVNELEYRYSYAIRNVDLRYNVKEYDQVLPIRDDQVAIRNLLGYTERLAVRDWESQRAIDSQWNTFWKSSPQPTANALVPFYIDVRDKDGNAQLIDSVEVDPVYTGPSMNVYYSNDETLGRDFRLSRYKQDLQMLGTDHEFTTDGLAITGVDSAAYLQDNDYMRFDTERSFVLGLTYTIDAQSGGTILDFGTVELQYDSQSFRLVANDGRVLIERSIDVYEGDKVAVNGGFIHKDDRFILGQDEYFQYDAMAVYDTFDTYDGQPIDDDLDGGWYLHLTRLVFQPKFQRDSIAYLSGEDYNPNQPRIQNNTLLLEEGTENILDEATSWCNDWVSNGGSTLSIFLDVLDPYAERNAVRVEATGGDSAYKARMSMADLSGTAAGQVVVRAYEKPIKVTPRDSGQEFIVRPDEGWHFLRWFSEPATGNDQIQIRALDPETEEESAQEDIVFTAAYAQYEYLDYHTSWQVGSQLRANETVIVPRDILNIGSTVYIEFIYPEHPAVLMDAQGEFSLLVDYENIALQLHGYQITLDGANTGDRVSIAFSVMDDLINLSMYNITQGQRRYDGISHSLSGINVESNVYIGSDASGGQYINSAIYSFNAYGPGFIYTYTPVTEEFLHEYSGYVTSTEEPIPYLHGYGLGAYGAGGVPTSEINNLWFNEDDGYLYEYDGSEWNKVFRETVTTIGDESREIYSYSFENDEENVFVADMLAQSLSKYDVGNMVEGIIYDLTLGSNSELTEPAGGKLQFVYVRQDRFSHILARKYAKSPERFTFLDGPMDRLRGDQNALFMARFLMGTEQDVARVGPNHKYYADKIWTPLYRDFKVRQGSLVFEPIHAKYVKLEFTDLVARPYKIDGENAVRRWYYDFPDWVHAYFEDIESRNFDAEQQGQGVPFEGNPIYDRTKHGMTMVDPVSGELVIFSTEPKKFYRTSYHDYKLKEMEQDYNQAFFVGLRDVKVYRRDFQVGDQPKIFDTFGDLKLVSDYTMNYLPDNEQFISTDLGQYVETVTFDSYSMYQTIQLAVQAAHWESQLSDKQLSLVTTNHLMSMNARSDNIADRITGEGAGKVLEARPVEPSEYGFRTKRGLTGVNSLYPAYDFADDPYDVGGNTYDDHFNILTANVRTSAIARIFLERANTNAVYELRLYQQEWLVSRKRFTNLGRGFHELELVYMSKSGDMDYQAEIVEIISSTDQMDTRLALDFLGIFQNPITWEVSNDGGSTWRYVLASINNYNGYIAFPQRGNQLKVRATAYRPGVVVSSYTVIPWYIESPVVSRSPIDYITPDGVSESDDLRDTKHKPVFQLWHRWFPRKYSIEQHGRVPIAGEGFQP